MDGTRHPRKPNTHQNAKTSIYSPRGNMAPSNDQSERTDLEVRRRLGYIAETLANLNYLVERNADDAQAVRQYTSRIGNTINVLAELLRGA